MSGPDKAKTDATLELLAGVAPGLQAELADLIVDVLDHTDAAPRGYSLSDSEYGRLQPVLVPLFATHPDLGQNLAKARGHGDDSKYVYSRTTGIIRIVKGYTASATAEVDEESVINA